MTLIKPLCLQGLIFRINMKARIKHTTNNRLAYLTHGKEYEVLEIEEETGDFGRLFYIEDDAGERIFCLENECAFLNNGSWELIE